MEVPKRTRIYKIITADSAEKLEKEVNELLEAGWDLVGGVSVSVVTDWRDDHLDSAYSIDFYEQAMITTL